MSEPPHDSSGVGIRARLTLALIGVAILPIVALVVVVLVLERAFDGPVVEAPAGPILLFAFAVIIALRILAAIDEVSPRDDVEALVVRTAADATKAFALIDAVVVMGDPATVPAEDVVPGVSRPLRAVLRAGGEDLGVLIGRLPATRGWEPADQDLLELF